MSALPPAIPVLVSLLVSWVNPKYLQHSYIREAQESTAETLQRYQEIAEAARAVAYDPLESPLLGSRQNTLVLLLAIARHESNFRKDVDLGVGKYARGDSGRSWCMMQINLGAGTVPVPYAPMNTWTGKDLVADREKCFRAGLHLLRRGYGACAHLPQLDRLSAYTSGRCQTGEPAAQRRMRFALRGMRQLPALAAAAEKKQP